MRLQFVCLMPGIFPFISVLPSTSTTSSSNITMPLRSFISRFVSFIVSVSADFSTSRNTAAGVHDIPPRRPWEGDFISSLHTIYGYLTGLLLTFMEIKYQGSSTNPFSEHPTLMTLILTSVFVYVIALIITLRSSNHTRNHHHPLKVMLYAVCHMSGALACELLLLLLISPVSSLLINVSSLALIIMLVSCYLFLHGEEVTEGQGSHHHTVDLEAAPTISTA